MIKAVIVWISGFLVIAKLSYAGPLCMCPLSSCMVFQPGESFLAEVADYCPKNRLTATDVSFIGMDVEELPPYVLAEFPNVSTFDIFHGTLKRINSNAFANATHLKNLVIKATLLEHIDDYMFEGANNLAVLGLSGHHISEISQNALANLRELENIMIMLTNITTLPSQMFINNSKLTSIIMSHNRIDSIQPDTFEGLSNLKTLDLAYNHIKVFEFKELSVATLKLHNNGLDHLHINTYHRSITAGNNAIRSITVDGTEVTELLLTNNKISVIGNLTKLSNLKILHLGQNPLEPSTVFSMFVKLEELLLQSTYINITSNTFAELGSLKVLDLSYNKLKVLDFKQLNSLQSLTILAVVGNRIQFMNYLEAKENLPQLKVLEICNNGWNETYLKSNIERMKHFKIRPDVYGLATSFIFKDGFINHCSHKIESDYDDSVLDDEDDEEVQVKYALQEARDSMKVEQTSVSSLPTKTEDIGVTDVSLTYPSFGTTESVITRHHHIEEYDPPLGGPGVSAVMEHSVQKGSVGYTVFNVFAYILAAFGLITIVGILILWKMGHINGRVLSLNRQSNDQVQLV